MARPLKLFPLSSFTSRFKFKAIYLNPALQAEIRDVLFNNLLLYLLISIPFSFVKIDMLVI
jgi:hypothetical protein